MEHLRGDIAVHMRAPIGVPPEGVQSLNLEHMGLEDVRLGRYTSLTKLRLRGNDFTSLEGLGLDALPSLRALDLRDCHLDLSNDHAAELVLSHVAGMANLEFIGLAGNRTVHVHTLLL